MKSYYFLISFLFVVVAETRRINYSGDQLIRAKIETAQQMKFMRVWQSTSAVDFWSFSDKPNGFVDIHVTTESFNYVVKTLNNLEMSYKIHIADLGELERQEAQSIALRRALFSGKAIDFENYHPYEEVMAYLADLSATNALVTTKVGGTTLEGRDIVQAIISSNVTANKPVNFFDCDIHSREWITTATCIWIIDQLTSKYGSDPEITSLIDAYDWKFVPITNPDGYAYTWSTDRLWRKNRNLNNGSSCLGVDINRNFPIDFGGPDGGSNNPCDQVYHGVAAFSERESSVIRDLITADRGRIRAAISVHSYGQEMLSPYGNTLELPPDYSSMLRAMEITTDAIKATFGTQYTYGTFSNTLYLGSGVTTDYYYQSEGITHSYTIEVRDLGEYAFILPADQILPTAIETWNGIKALVQAI